MDPSLQRYVKDADQAYANGQLEPAIANYRKALRRAWAMDDPRESGTAAYNLAACLMSDSKFGEARDWLLDARVEYGRAGLSTGNVWLLEAKLARLEYRFEEVDDLLRRAACSEAPCSQVTSSNPCSDRKFCCGNGEGCVIKIPVIGRRLEKHRAGRDCRNAYQAEIHLIRARAAAEQYEITSASREWALACELVDGIGSCDLQAELHDVAAMIHIAQGDFLRAAHHLDRETECLRWAGNYREIPPTLELASAAYQQAERLESAAGRLCRAARVLYGRGDLNHAWQVVQRAIPLAEATCTESTRIRLALLAHEILMSMTEEDGDTQALLPARFEGGMIDAEALIDDTDEPDFEITGPASR